MNDALKQIKETTFTAQMMLKIISVFLVGVYFIFSVDAHISNHAIHSDKDSFNEAWRDTIQAHRVQLDQILHRMDARYKRLKEEDHEIIAEHNKDIARINRLFESFLEIQVNPTGNKIK